MTPPEAPLTHSLHAERATLCAMLLSGDAVDIVSERLSAESFYLERHRFIYEAILGLAATNGFIDALTVRDELDKKKRLEAVGGYDYLSALLDAEASAAGAKHYAEIVKSFAKRRALFSALAEANTKAKDRTVTADEAIDFTERNIFAIRDTDAPEVIHAMEFADVVSKEIANREMQTEKISGIRTGLEKFDGIIDGFGNGTTNVVAAKTSYGKTTLALQFTNQAATDEKIVDVFSYEMRAKELFYRAVSLHARIPFIRIKQGRFFGDEGKRVADAIKSASRLPVRYHNVHGGTVDQLRGNMRRAVRTGSKLIVIDYIQKIRGEKGSRGNRQEEMAYITGVISDSAREFDVPILALSQFRRFGNEDPNREPELSDLRESGAIEHDADTVTFIHRPPTKSTDDQESRTRGYLIVKKNRNGPADVSIDIRFHPESGRFEEIEVERKTKSRGKSEEVKS